MHAGRYVIMGVSGAGKSRVGRDLAEALSVEFVEGDQYHPPENVARMAAGVALTDDDRVGWLTALAERLREARAAGAGLVLSCSALRRPYRDLLRTGDPDVRVVWLDGPRALLAERLAGRRGHFMPPALLDSQLATLEIPAVDEAAWRCDISRPPEAIIAALLTRIAAEPALPPGLPGQET